MRAMLLAAGRGERMRPLTDDCPKPLLRAGGYPLIDYHLRALAAADVREVVINTAWLGERIEAAVGDGARYGIAVHYSHEPVGALETGGGIARALPLLGDAPFLVVNGDVWCDFPLAQLPLPADDALAHLLLVNNPAHHPQGDFGLRDGRIQGRAADVEQGGERLTFAGIATFRPQMFSGRSGRFALGPMLFDAADRGQLCGTHHRGRWWDVGTPQRLADLDAWLRATPAADSA